MSSNGKSIAQQNRQVRQAALREQLEKQGHLQHVIVLLEKIEKLEDELNATELQRLKLVIDTKLKLMNKYIPDLKAVEMTGEGGGELTVKVMKYTPEAKL